jgi:hypothetical protein
MIPLIKISRTRKVIETETSMIAAGVNENRD